MVLPPNRIDLGQIREQSAIVIWRDAGQQMVFGKSADACYNRRARNVAR
jgi:hypothetical protein